MLTNKSLCCPESSIMICLHTGITHLHMLYTHTECKHRSHVMFNSNFFIKQFTMTRNMTKTRQPYHRRAYNSANLFASNIPSPPTQTCCCKETIFNIENTEMGIERAVIIGVSQLYCVIKIYRAHLHSVLKKCVPF